MATLLQKTKLFPPPARARLVQRARLLERLDAIRAEGCRAALVSAPAGSGKTTILVQWLNRPGWPFAWVSLDARDNLPARFFSYLIAALKEAAPGAGSEALALLDLPAVDPQEVVTLLANDLADAASPLETQTMAGQGFILVLDDFHTITNPALHRAVDLLLEAQPPWMRVVLLSREDPALQLARRRARGELVELRQDDLRFSLREAVDFLNDSMGLRLTTGQVETLEARTEGWIAGLQMAALSLQRAPDAERFIRDFSGSQRFILDYLMEEVLAHQTQEVQGFLLDTSILERMCAALCGRVAGGRWSVDREEDEVDSQLSTSDRPLTTEHCQLLLEHLERSNLFLIPLDEERHWYRYHHLFNDLLLARLQAKDPGRAAGLYRRAADWYEENGDPRLAVEYALKAGDPQRAGELFERFITGRWQTVDMEFFMLAGRLPPEVVAARPSLSLHSAWMYVITGQNERILPLVEAAERCLDAAGAASRSGNQVPPPLDAAGTASHPRTASGPASPLDATNRAFASVLRAYLADFQNQPVRLDDSLEQAFAAIPEENVGMRNSVAVVIGTICYMEGDFANALRYFEAALELDRRVSGTNAVPIATMHITRVLQAQGKLREALRRLIEAERYVRERGSRRFYISGAINLMWGDLLVEWNRLDEAEAQFNEGMRLLEDWPMTPTRGLGNCLITRLKLARGDLAGARAVFEQVEAMQPGRFHPEFLQSIERARVRLWAAEQNRTALETWARENASLADLEPCFRYEARQVELARAWLSLGREEEAAALLERLAEAARGRGGDEPPDGAAERGGGEPPDGAAERGGSRLRILALMAAAYGGGSERGMAALEEALRLGEPEGYLRTFVEAGEGLRRALETWLQQGMLKDSLSLREYAGRILAAFPGREPVQPRAASPALSEPLSERELEVLRLVAKGLTNQQIAERLVISIRTVKKHIENIHGKLDVQNRTQAAARARELGVIE